MKNYTTIVFIGFLLLAITTQADALQTVGVPIKVGFSVTQVKNAYFTDLKPVVSDVPDKTVMDLRGLGVKVFFFNTSGKVDTIRLDAPFRGSVQGIKIGDSLPTLQKKLGKPSKIIGTATRVEGGYIYLPKDKKGFVRFDLDDSNEVETIFLGD